MSNKRILSVLLALSLVLATVLPVVAQTRHEAGIVSPRVAKCAQTGLFVTSQVDEYHRVTKTVKRIESTHTQEFSNNPAKARAILLRLGVRPYNIGRLSPDQLDFVANSPRITSVISYTKGDGSGNVIFLDPATAYSEAERANRAELDALESILQQQSRPDFFVDIDPKTGGHLNDGIMSLIHVAAASDSDPSRYLFITDALWLQMPSSRRTDSVGSVASSIAVDFGSMAGWYSYQRRTTTGSHVTDHLYSRIATTQHRTNGSWQGTAALLNMPLDATVTRPIFIMHRHSNFNAVNIFEGLVVHPQLITNFNSIGAHYHKGIGIGAINPTVSISFGVEGVAASIGLSPTLHVTTRRHVPLLLTYRP